MNVYTGFRVRRGQDEGTIDWCGEDCCTVYWGYRKGHRTRADGLEHQVPYETLEVVWPSGARLTPLLRRPWLL